MMFFTPSPTAVPHHAGVIAAQVGILVVKSLGIKQEIVHILIISFGAVGRDDDRLTQNGGKSRKQYQQEKGILWVIGICLKINYLPAPLGSRRWDSP